MKLIADSTSVDSRFGALIFERALLVNVEIFSAINVSIATSKQLCHKKLNYRKTKKRKRKKKLKRKEEN